VAPFVILDGILFALGRVCSSLLISHRLICFKSPCFHHTPTFSTLHNLSAEKFELGYFSLSYNSALLLSLSRIHFWASSAAAVAQESNHLIGEGSADQQAQVGVLTYCWRPRLLVSRSRSGIMNKRWCYRAVDPSADIGTGNVLKFSDPK
jgi:hypothetical protein